VNDLTTVACPKCNKELPLAAFGILSKHLVECPECGHVFDLKKLVKKVIDI
jgi:transposase